MKIEPVSPCSKERSVNNTKEIRLDSIPLDNTYYTDEGYLIDHPILTSCGIFEYTNSDGSIRRELRIPEEVFADESLASYEGKPVIVTHEAGTVDKSNVHRENIGTILSKGYRDGNDVRAKIIIHDTDLMRQSGLRELSLGYALTLDKTPGVWNGEPYDAIQRNIEINHLALVDNARAGDQARLNIDSKDPQPLKGGKAKMKKATKGITRKDGAVSPEELASIIKQFNDRRNSRMAAKQDLPTADDDDVPQQAPQATQAPVTTDDDDTTPALPKEPAANTDCDAVQTVRDRRDRRDAEGDPQDMQGAMGVIANQDEDIENLLNVIEQLKAEKDFNAAPANTDDDDVPAAPVPAQTNTDDDDDTDDEPVKSADDDDEPQTPAEKPEENTDDDDVAEAETKSMNADSMDKVFRARLDVVRTADRLNLDGVESMSILGGKKAIIRKVRPDIRLDGKSPAYINAMYDFVKDSVVNRKDTNYQRRQMMSGKNHRADGFTNSNLSGAEKSRRKMIERMTNQGGND